MIIKETPNKTGLSSIKVTKPSFLKVSFSKIIDDNNFGLPMPSDEKVNNAKKIQKIIKTLLTIRSKTGAELVTTNKSNNIGGCERCDIQKWSWQNQKIKNYLKKISKNTIYIIRAGESRIFGSIEHDVFFVYCIEYKLGDIYKH